MKIPYIDIRGDNMKVAGLCHSCGRPAILTCPMCGKVVCRNCYDAPNGLCVTCARKGPIGFEKGY